MALVVGSALVRNEDVFVEQAPISVDGLGPISLDGAGLMSLDGADGADGHGMEG